MSRGKIHPDKIIVPPVNYPEVASRIGSLIPDRGQKAFAEAIGISPQHLNNILKNRAPASLEIIAAVANTQAVSFDWILTGVGRTPPGLETVREKAIPPYLAGFREARHHLLEASRLLPADESPGAPTMAHFVGRGDVPKFDPDDFAFVKLLSDSAAAGNPREINDNDIEGWCVIHKSTLRHPASTICIRVKGDSMEPILPDGSIVGVNHAMQDPDALAGKIIAAYADEGVTIKRLWMNKGGYILVSENRSRPPMPLDSDRGDRGMGHSAPFCTCAISSTVELLPYSPSVRPVEAVGGGQTIFSEIPDFSLTDSYT